MAGVIKVLLSTTFLLKSVTVQVSSGQSRETGKTNRKLDQQQRSLKATRLTVDHSKTNNIYLYTIYSMKVSQRYPSERNCLSIFFADSALMNK